MIVSEDLAISNMVKNHNLAKAISDCGWYELTRQLAYKAEWNGRTYIKLVDIYRQVRHVIYVVMLIRIPKTYQ